MSFTKILLAILNMSLNLTPNFRTWCPNLKVTKTKSSKKDKLIYEVSMITFYQSISALTLFEVQNHKKWFDRLLQRFLQVSYSLCRTYSNYFSCSWFCFFKLLTSSSSLSCKAFDFINYYFMLSPFTDYFVLSNSFFKLWFYLVSSANFYLSYFISLSLSFSTEIVVGALAFFKETSSVFT